MAQMFYYILTIFPHDRANSRALHDFTASLSNLSREQHLGTFWLPTWPLPELHSYNHATIPTCPGHSLTFSLNHLAALIWPFAPSFSSAECEILNERVRTGATCVRPADSGGAVQSDAITWRRGFGGVRGDQRGEGGSWLFSKF